MNTRTVMVAAMLLFMAIPAAAQVATLLTGDLTGAALRAKRVDATEYIRDSDPLKLLVAQSFVAAEDERVATLPAGAILPTVDECPSGWEPYLGEDGEPLYIPFGMLVDEHGNLNMKKGYYLLRACVRQ